MIGNILNILLGLSLAYSAIFSTPAGAMNNAALAVGAIAIIVLALWARRTDPMGWPSGTDIALGVLLLLVSATRWVIGVPPLVCFWIILLVGIAVAIAAMWSLLYRPGTAQSEP